MAFNGTWEEYEEVNYEEFLRAISMPEDAIQIAKDEKTITDIQQNGDDFVTTTKTPTQTVSNSYTIGKEADMNINERDKMKCSVRMEGGKLICQSEMFTHVREIQGDDMVETVTVGSASFSRKSRKI
ncbi:fatty acid-binding protein 10-A, liver basic-like [Anguilla anguilla]|uniref:fatty acid-binding protein 10-A, liver basic-like n=1 Tax=Anguilla anguilla TaxID=7936 RepID=UPI0015B24ED3|nr:fatty acid-binding protein 10-A, liver basic-like [Anguilla anguilla]